MLRLVILERYEGFCFTTKQRLRAMDMLAPEPWSKWRIVSAWLASHTSKIIVGVLVTLVSASLLAYLNLTL